MEKLKRYDLNCNIFNVYDYDGLSMQELLCQFFTKINECVDFSNSTLDLCEWLVNEGLKQEAALKLTTWLNDGTLNEIINHSVFNELNEKVNNKLDKDDIPYINVKDYGIIGDGETDITQQLQSLINEKSNYIWRGNKKDTFTQSNKIHLVFPQGQYVISDTIFLPPYITLEGTDVATGYNYVYPNVDFKNNGVVFIGRFTDSKKPMFSTCSYDENGNRDYSINKSVNGVTSSGYDRIEGINLKNFMILCESKLLCGISLILSPCTNISNVHIIGTDIGIYITNSWCVNVNKCSTFSKNYGILCNNNVNRLNIDECNIDHYNQHEGTGLPQTRYTVTDIKCLYAPDGTTMNPQEYAYLTTGVYLVNTWQVRISNSSLQAYERGVFAFQSNVKIDSNWFEVIRKIDIHKINGSVYCCNNRKETLNSKHIKTGGTGTFVVDTLHGSSVKGDSIKDINYLIDSVSTGSKCVINNITYDSGTFDTTMLSAHEVSGIKTYKSNSTIDGIHLEKNRYNVTQGTEYNFTLPPGYTKNNLFVASAMIENSSGIFVTITDVKITDTLVKFVSPITQSNAYVKILLIGTK